MHTQSATVAGLGAAQTSDSMSRVRCLEPALSRSEPLLLQIQLPRADVLICEPCCHVSPGLCQRKAGTPEHGLIRVSQTWSEAPPLQATSHGETGGLSGGSRARQPG